MSFRLTECAPFYRGGPLSNNDLVPGSWPARFPALITGFIASIDVAKPLADANIIFDILVIPAGSTTASSILSSGQRPQLLAGTAYIAWDAQANGVNYHIQRGDGLQVKIVQAGTTNPGYNCTMSLEYSYTG